MAKRNDEVLRRITKLLPVALTDGELRDRGSALALTREKLETQRIESSVAKKQLKEAEEKLELETSRLAHIVRDRCEAREVPVEVRVGKRAGYIDEVRTDTGEVLHSRKMHPDEAQGDFLDADFQHVFREDPAEAEAGARR